MKKYFFDFNGVNIAKHWHVAGRGICHLCFALLIKLCSAQAFSSYFHKMAAGDHFGYFSDYLQNR